MRKWRSPQFPSLNVTLINLITQRSVAQQINWCPASPHACPFRSAPMSRPTAMPPSALLWGVSLGFARIHSGMSSVIYRKDFYSISCHTEARELQREATITNVTGMASHAATTVKVKQVMSFMLLKTSSGNCSTESIALPGHRPDKWFLAFYHTKIIRVRTEVSVTQFIPQLISHETPSRLGALFL